MARIWLNHAVPNNIHEVPLRETKRIRSLFERGEVVVLSDVRIEADFDYLSTIEAPHGSGSRRGKYVFWRVVDGKRDERRSVWDMFRTDVLGNSAAEFERFEKQVRSVDRQLDGIVRSIFNRHNFLTETITWKFQRNRGENMHIDNLQGSERVAQVRLFANLDSKSRKWSIGHHWRHYAERHYADAALHEVAGDPVRFNHRLTAAAFGASADSCDEPRHLVEFDPGEIWLANSALVAHQVRGGDVLALAHHEYAYDRYVDRSQSLPMQLRALARRRGAAQPGFMDQMKFAAAKLKARVTA